MADEQEVAFKKGDVVMLKSGSCRMTVLDLAGNSMIRLGWITYNVNDFKEAFVPHQAIQIANPRR